MVRKSNGFLGRMVLTLVVVTALCLPVMGQEKAAEQEGGIQWELWITLGCAAVAAVWVLFQFLRRKKEKESEAYHGQKGEEKYQRQLKTLSEKQAQKEYCATVKAVVRTSFLSGSADFEFQDVDLEDSFVSLRISQHYRSDKRSQCLEAETGDRVGEPSEPGVMYPEEVIHLAFQHYKLLLVIGDPGSGKTTLMKYYALRCLDKKHKGWRDLGLESERGIMPIFFPLRDILLDGDTGQPLPLSDNLAEWARRRDLGVSAGRFRLWLRDRQTLVLLDGLDEIGDKETRKKVCRWITEMSQGYSETARFVVTSRATGYRKLDGIELQLPHLRADIMDFSPGQQQDFLEKWFRAVCTSRPRPSGTGAAAWRRGQEEEADRRSRLITAFLNREENRTVRDLASVPVLLNIMALLWKDQEYLPRSRAALYDAALNYLLEHRDRQKDIDPALPAREARWALAPAALWMQEELRRDEAPKLQFHRKVQPELDTMNTQSIAEEFCFFLRDRAGIIADYDREHYIFRHKSFREYLAGLQAVREAGKEERVEVLAGYLKDEWWTETLRFFMAEADAGVFDRFMDFFFASQLSWSLTDHQQDLLQRLVREAPRKKIDSLVRRLHGRGDVGLQRHYILDCLKTVGTPAAYTAIREADKSGWPEILIRRSLEVVAEAEAEKEFKGLLKNLPQPGGPFETLPATFRAPFEGGVEYIKIPGGIYTYSDTKKLVTVPGFYMCKYPVTNKRYRNFIKYLEGKREKLGERLPRERFVEKLLAYGETLSGFEKYIGTDEKEWPGKFRSEYDEDKQFNGDDQPVVGIKWYAAGAYCFWLSCLEAAFTGDSALDNLPGPDRLYRLPNEQEWEWAAGGEPDGSMREYPWSADKGGPTPELANYGSNVGATTPVGRYPEGATPQGLMDMAGNVWEWMENYWDKKGGAPALRGGSWGLHDSLLRCSARGRYHPHDWDLIVGLRVLRPQSTFLKL